jgi:pimeloyl-ACP methyl ester carboxylesterase
MIVEHLSVSLADGTHVPNVWTRQADSQTLAVILPGAGYTALGPVLHYPRLWALGNGIDTLTVDYRASGKMAWQEAADYTAACAVAVFDAVARDHSYRKFMVIGKSLGTRAMGPLLEQRPVLQSSTCVWLTPIFADNAMMDTIQRYRPPSLLVVGTDDPSYDEERLNVALQATSGTSLVIEGANHSLELKNDVRGSLAVIPRLLDALDQL